VSRYLIDTNVISSAAPTAAVKPLELIQWMDFHSSDLFLSTISVAEIADGIARVKRQGAVRKASEFSAWLETVLHLYSDRVLAFDSATAQIAGALSDLARSRGRPSGLADVIIAATARQHDLIILSRNERHFTPMDAVVIDPFRQLPPT
jgi:predicted nucleic acid-binding protein